MRGISSVCVWFLIISSGGGHIFTACIWSLGQRPLHLSASELELLTLRENNRCLVIQCLIHIYLFWESNQSVCSGPHCSFYIGLLPKCVMNVSGTLLDPCYEIFRLFRGRSGLQSSSWCISWMYHGTKWAEHSTCWFFCEKLMNKEQSSVNLEEW